METGYAILDLHAPTPFDLVLAVYPSFNAAFEALQTLPAGDYAIKDVRVFPAPAFSLN